MLDALTFTDSDLVQLSKDNFISLKIDAESDYGLELFNQLNGTGYPLIIFVVCFGLFILYWVGSFFLGIIQVMTGTYF